MLSVGGLPVPAAPGNGHRRSRSDCGLNKRDAVADLAPLGGTRTPTGLRSHSPLPGGRHRHDVQRNAHTRPHTPVMMRSPSTSSIPEIFISGDDTDYPGMSPVTRLAVFSLADFIETVTPR